MDKVLMNSSKGSSKWHTFGVVLHINFHKVEKTMGKGCIGGMRLGKSNLG